MFSETVAGRLQQKTMSDFVHLHCHTEYSLLDGLSKIKKLLTKVKEYGMTSVAITDHGVMYGAIEFYKACLAEGIKPILGMEGYVVNGDHTKKSGKEDKENNHLVLLAKNYAGYRNLMKISTIAHTEGFYYRPRISKSVLRKYAEGIICLSACPKGEIAELLIEGHFDKAKEAVGWYRETFGDENYYLEVQRHFYKDYFDSVKDMPKISENLHKMQQSEDIWIREITKLSRVTGVPLVATNDAHYIDKNDAGAQDALVCIATGKNVTDTDRLRYVDTQTFYLRPPQEMTDIFPDLPDAISNTVKIAQSTDIKIELGKWHFPEIVIPTKKSAPDYLRELVMDRLADRYPVKSKEVEERANYELDIIITKGYAPYFLMMQDMVNWCTGVGIITNTRGSAAGSVVSYILGITTVDPVKYQLPFERFLNPMRPKPPDIDLDIADDRREELIVQITSQYGSDKVAQICTFGRMLARAAIRDVGRVLGYPYSIPDKIAKLIPMGSQGFPMTLRHALEISPELKIIYDTDADAKKIIDLAQEIEGNARHSSVHAAGTVVSPTAMTDFTPLMLEPNGTKIITQYEMHACEDVGLVKFDILGIRNLSILGAARDIIESSRKIKIDLGHLPLEDKETFSMLSRGETMGAFQLGGSGMTKWLKELKPNRVEDIMVMIALFRPGPMANIPEYIARKNGRSPVTYLHPKMANFLDKSYGILVYQEDILFTALELAGYDWGSVDALRQAIGKKKPKEMAQQHEIFVEGCQKHSAMTKDEAEKIWDLFVPFQGYGFNKAHAASYGLVSYQTAYLKAHYPVEYMTALLSAESGNTDKVVEAVDECRRMKIKVLAPDINKSQTGFTFEPVPDSKDGRAIRFGLSAIKNVGEAAITSILSVRNQKLFVSLTDFILRVDNQKVNRKVIESLIKAGALDSFGKRSAMLAGLEKIREMGTSLSKLKSLGQVSLFTSDEPVDDKDDFPDLPEFEKAQKLAMEKELLGFYLTEHPHSDHIVQMRRLTSHTLGQLHEEDLHGQSVIVGGIVEACRNVITKNGNQPMCFAKITDTAKSIEVVVFPKTFALSPALWQVDNIVLLSGKVESKISGDFNEDTGEVGREITIIVDTAVAFTGIDTVLPAPPVRNSNFYRQPANTSAQPQPAASHPAIPIYIPKGLPQSKLVSLNSFLQSHKGDTAVELVFENGASAKVIPLPYGLNWSPGLKSQIDSILNST